MGWSTMLTKLLHRFGINLFTRIPLRAGTTFVGAMVYGVRKFDLVNGGRVYPPYAMYADWGNLPGFTMVPSLQQVSPWLGRMPQYGLVCRPQLPSLQPKPARLCLSTWCQCVQLHMLMSVAAF